MVVSELESISLSFIVTPPSSVQDQPHRVVSNRFHVLEDETDDQDNSKHKKDISTAAETTNGDSTNMTKEKKKTTRPKLIRPLKLCPASLQP